MIESSTADRLAETAERVAERLDGINGVIAGIPLYASIWMSLSHASEDLKREVATYRIAAES